MLLYDTLFKYAIREADHIHMAYADMNTSQEHQKCKPQDIEITPPNSR